LAAAGPRGLSELRFIGERPSGLIGRVSYQGELVVTQAR
jgi:hypothetical protein